MDPAAILREFGLEILCIFALGAVVVYLYRKVNLLNDKLFALMDTRHKEALVTQEQLRSTLDNFSQTSQLLVDKIVPVQRGKK